MRSSHSDHLHGRDHRHEDRCRHRALVPFDFSIYDEFPSLKRLNVDIDVHTVSPVIDSSNVEPANWVALARLIRDNYAR